MYDLIAIVAGITLALSTQGLDAFPYRVPTLVIASGFFGAIVALVSGELAVSRAFLVFDAIQVLLVACLSWAAIALWQRRSIRRPNG